MRIYFYHLIILLPLLSYTAYAQNQELRFHRVNGPNGISIGQVNSITQDKYGFLWFSEETNQCITRFDGHNYKRYVHNTENPNSLGGRYPETLFIDELGIIWIGFYGEGLDRFDPVTETFTHFSYDSKNPKGLSNNFVTSMLIDHAGNFWVGTHGGLNLFDRRKNEFSHFVHADNDAASLSSNTVRAVYEDRQGTLWVGTGFFSEDPGGLNRFERDTKTFTRYTHNPKDDHSLADSRTTALFEDSQGTFWVGTNGNVLHTMNRKTGSFTRYKYDANHPQNLSAPPAKGIDIISFIKEDQFKNLWIGSAYNGINKFDPTTQRVTHYGNNTDASGTFIENTSWYIFVARDGMIWLSTQPGLYTIKPYNVIPYVANELDVYFQESETILWIGTNTGLKRKDLTTGQTIIFKHDAYKPNSLSNDSIRDILKDKEGNIWIATGRGLNRYENSTGRFTHFLHDVNNRFSLSSNDVDFVARVAQGPGASVWIGYWNSGGIGNLNYASGKYKHYLHGMGVFNFFVDHTGTFWAATAIGLFRYHEQKDIFVSVITDASQSIVEDEENNIWVNSSKGLNKINSDRDQIVLYPRGNASTAMWYSNNQFKSSYKDQQGQLFLADANGHYRFNPRKIKNQTDTSRLYFTSFWINEREIRADTLGPLKESLYTANRIELQHDQNIFSLTFTELDFNNETNNRISYQLENYDKVWRETSAEERVTYFNVPPGNYLFKIRAQNSISGAWSENALAISVLPPWWSTWWAYSMYTITIVVGIVVIEQIWRRRVIEKEMVKQANEIKKQNLILNEQRMTLAAQNEKLILSQEEISVQRDLVALQNSKLSEQQLKLEDQNERLNKLNSEKDNLIGIVAHDLKTPLGQILGLINLLKFSTGSPAHQKETAEYLQVMEKSALRLTSMIGKILDVQAIEAKQLNLKLEALNFSEIVKQVIDAFSLEAQKKQIEIRYSLPSEISAVLDRGYTEQIIENLISNALKFSPAGKQIYVDVLIRDSKVTCMVKDEGPGINEQDMKKLFTKYQRLSAHPTGNETSTGLGLAIVKKFVDALGGEISCESSPGEGAAFIVSFNLYVKTDVSEIT